MFLYCSSRILTAEPLSTIDPVWSMTTTPAVYSLHVAHFPLFKWLRCPGAQSAVDGSVWAWRLPLEKMAASAHMTWSGNLPKWSSATGENSSYFFAIYIPISLYSLTTTLVSRNIAITLWKKHFDRGYGWIKDSNDFIRHVIYLCPRTNVWKKSRVFLC